MIDEDIIQRIKVAGIFFLQVYKVTTGTMLSLFIPPELLLEEETLLNQTNMHRGTRDLFTQRKL